ncbi:hypothetical protein PGT21_024755 [Puccinia graminis f. sp. tritici]|uniref:Uncharacterized protein n=1 Tax=Puccinia graminis f. sp. tritici TaxID=56615 RepID=A0A5B0QPH6_PUCGR|nr:hypothetical protein PGT21_024755 [Puccinia graminis f. sp. tritici]
MGTEARTIRVRLPPGNGSDGDYDPADINPNNIDIDRLRDDCISLAIVNKSIVKLSDGHLYCLLICLEASSGGFTNVCNVNRSGVKQTKGCMAPLIRPPGLGSGVRARGRGPAPQ